MSEQKKVMGQGDYLKVVALLHMAHKHMEKVKEYEAALAPLVGEGVDDSRHAGDAIWQPYTADELIKRAGYVVEATHG